MESCQNHQNIDCLLLCMEPDCWSIICSECLYKHIKEKHPKKIQNNLNANLPYVAPKNEVKIKALKSVQGEIVNFLITVKCLYQKELKRLENIFLRINREHEDNLEKIRASKERILDLIIDVFQRIQTNYTNKVNLDEMNHQCEHLIDKMKTGLSDIDIFQNCFSDTFNPEKDLQTLEVLLKKYGKNELSDEQYAIVTTVHEIASKQKESHIAVAVDDSRLYSMGIELSKFVKVVEEEDAIRPKILMIESKDSFKPDVAKSLHFFEDGTRYLHLLTVDQLKKDLLSPKHDVISLLNEDFLVPSYHRSIVTPDGDIFLTGGNNDTGRDSTLAYQLNLAKKLLEPIDSMLKPRNSHGMAYLEGFIYVAGGNSNEEGSVASCERYDIFGKKKWEKIANLNFAAYGPSLCGFRDKLLYKFGGKRNSWELTNTIEVYSPEKNKWTVVPFEFETQFDRKNFIIPCYAAAGQINHHEMLILGGSDANGNNLVQTFELRIVEKEEPKQRNFIIREVNKRPLPEAECYDMGQIIVYNGMLFCLQNSPVQALGFTTPGGSLKGGKRLMVFIDSHWITVKY